MQEVKEGLFDLISQTKESFTLESGSVKDLDALVKQMIMSSSFDFTMVQSLLLQIITTLSGHLKHASKILKKPILEEKVEAVNQEADRELKRRIEIVAQVFGQASNKLNRIDRDWQQVIDSQVYVLEELLSCSRSDQRTGQSGLEIALNDFSYTVDRLVECGKPMQDIPQKPTYDGWHELLSCYEVPEKQLVISQKSINLKITSV